MLYSKVVANEESNNPADARYFNPDKDGQPNGDEGVQAAAIVEGDPQPVNTVQNTGGEDGEEILILPDSLKKASLEILDKVASTLAEDQSEASLRLAMDLDGIAETIQKNAFMFSDTKNPGKEIKGAYAKGNRVVEGDVGLPDKDSFEKDISYEVNKSVKEKNASPYAKI